MSNAELIQQVTEAVAAHSNWKINLRRALLGGSSDFDPDTVRKDDACVFGRWLYGPTIDGRTRDGVPYRVVRRLHTEFHDCAATVLDLAITARKGAAEALYDSEFTQRSEKLVRALVKWKRELS